MLPKVSKGYCRAVFALARSLLQLWCLITIAKLQCYERYDKQQYIKSKTVMGLVYSLTQYFYPNNSPKLSQHAIKTKAKRLTLHIKQAQFRLQQQTIKHEQNLIKMMAAKSQIKRSREAQKLQMELIIKNSEKLLVYDQIVLCLNQIIIQSAMLEEKPSGISNQCIKAINSVIYVYESMQLKDFVSLNQFIPTPHPVICLEQTNPLIQKYLKEKEVSHFELNLYACQLCSRNKINLELFNQIGHYFKESPQEPHQESPSAHMFAITLDLIACQEQLAVNQVQ